MVLFLGHGPNKALNKRTRSRSLQWRHDERDSGSNHHPHDCLLNRLFGHRSKKAAKLRVTGLCTGNSPVTGEFPAQMASNAENVSIWWHHHALDVTMIIRHNSASRRTSSGSDIVACWWGRRFLFDSGSNTIITHLNVTGASFTVRDISKLSIKVAFPSWYNIYKTSARHMQLATWDN